MSKLSVTGGRFAPRRLHDSARSNAAQYAINGDFFTRNPPTFKPSGYAKSFGQEWPGTDTKHWEPAFAWSGHHVVFLPSGHTPPSWVDNVISARPRVLEAGAVVTHYAEPEKAARSRRTGAGISQDGRVFYLVAAASATAAEIGALLRRFGAADGITMDGGGSAQMISDGAVVQASSDAGGVRAVTNVLMVRFK